MITASAAGARATIAHPSRDARSRHAAALHADLMLLEPEMRRSFYRDLTQRDVDAVLRIALSQTGTPYHLWVDDPVGFVEDVLGETTWSKQREVLAAIPNHKRVAVPSAFGTGKCVYGLSVIPLADGRMVRAADLVGAGDFEIMAWCEDGTQVPRPARAAWNRTETVYRVQTTNGREVIRNTEHPLWAAEAVSTIEGGRASGTVTLTPQVRGWTPVGDLRAGDLVLVPTKHHAQGTQRVEHDHAALLGYLLGDGGTSDRQITFTQQPGEALEEFTAICDRLDVDLVEKKDRPYCHRLVGRLQPGQHPDLRRRTNAVLALVDQWGLAGHLATDKRFPDWAWTLPNDQLAVVLGRLMACDGWAYTRTTRGRIKAEVAITLANEGMIRDVEHAMLRLGVPGRVCRKRVKYDGGYRSAWTWTCIDREALVRLPDLLDMPGKNAVMRQVAAAVRAHGTARVRSWPTRNAPPGYRWERVTAVDALPEPDRTVSIEVDGEHTFVTSMVEHNTHISARAALWRSLVHPPGTSLTVTTATRFRQVQRQLWPHVRSAVAKAGLPMTADQTQLKATNADGVEVVVAYGFSAPPNDEAAVQGIHAPRLFIVVDEAGGISRIIGEAMRGLMTGDDTRFLAIGNPPTDDEGSWFEGLCGDDDVRTISISAYNAPLQSGEVTRRCYGCPETTEPHRLGKHLVDGDWIEKAIRDHGPDAPFVKAKVHAKFPRGGASRTIPSDWVDLAVESPEPDHGPGWHRLDLLGLEGEDRTHLVQEGSWVRLGVDVAADGGDELVIARTVGDLVTLEHTSAGAENQNSMDVAGKVLHHIRRAQALAKALGTTARVRVKVDGIGVGWGVAGTLTAWAAEGIHDADIVAVIVSEDTYREENPDSTFQPYRKRDEMWLLGRTTLQPRATTGRGAIRLRIETRTAAQLSAPKYGTTSGGKTLVESKKSMRARGLNSPDRGEAVLLSMYEPITKPEARQGTFRVLA